MKRGLLTLLVLCAGCSLDPPVPIEEDPELAELGAPLEDEQGRPRAWNPPPMVVAPVSFPYKRPADTLYPATDRKESPDEPEDEETLTWSHPPPPAGLQPRLRDLLDWSLNAWQDPKRTWPTQLQITLPNRALPPEERRRLVCQAADDQGAVLVAHLEVLECRVSFLHRDGLLWWTNLVLFWQVGVVPIIYVPDETYGMSMRVRFTILHARTEEQLFQREYEEQVDESLNDFQRGWTLSSLFFAHHLTLEPEVDLLEPYRALLPHVQRRLEIRILEDAREVLPRVLEDPETQALLTRGRPDKARACAIVIASSNPRQGPRSRASPPASNYAQTDAIEVARHLRTVVERDLHLAKVIDAPDPKQRIFAALDDLGKRCLWSDRLIVYFTGFGTTTRDGQPALVLDDGLLTLKELADQCVKALEHRPQVIFLLDASFGAERKSWGRNYRWVEQDPGGPGPQAGYLAVLGDDHRRWTVLAAASPGEAAYEWKDPDRPKERGGGLFTRFLLLGLQGEADGSKDGEITVDELFGYLHGKVRWLAAYLPREQTPEMVPATARNTLVARVP